jgi:phospholipid/cholesterol/gamma-HCH transport system ATP-binding protein
MNPEETFAIEFQNVSISFDNVRALQNISFTLRHGEMICVTGDSGSGKSVLLRLALGFLRPDEGKVLIDGRDITTMDESDLLPLRSREMGMVFQENSVFSGQSVYENTAYRLDDRGWSDDEIERSVTEILTFVGLQDELEKQAEELSGGMKRRLELARALVSWPSIMLLDEPTAGLDPINAHQVLDLIIRARDLHHTSSLFITKALHEIPYLARHHASEEENGSRIEKLDEYLPTVRVLLLEEGRMAFFGAPADFAQSVLPAVQHILHPVTGALHGEIDAPDPWGQNRKTKTRFQWLTKEPSEEPSEDLANPEKTTVS